MTHFPSLSQKYSLQIHPTNQPKLILVLIDCIITGRTTTGKRYKHLGRAGDCSHSPFLPAERICWQLKHPDTAECKAVPLSAEAQTAAHQPCKQTPEGKVIHLCIDTAEELQRLRG